MGTRVDDAGLYMHFLRLDPNSTFESRNKVPWLVGCPACHPTTCDRCLPEQAGEQERCVASRQACVWDGLLEDGSMTRWT